MPANFVDHRVSARASRQFRRVAVGRTDIVPLDNGDDIRNARWKYKKLKFSASYALLSPEAQIEISSAFYAVNAQLLYFRFRDYGDFQVINSPLVTPMGTTNPVQLTKRYTFGPAFADRRIQAVDVCEVAGVPGTFDSVLGLFTPTDPWPAASAVWSGTFSCWVRFNSDEFDMTLMTLDIATVDVELIEGRARR